MGAAERVEDVGSEMCLSSAKDALATDVLDAVFDATLKPLLKRLKDTGIRQHSSMR